MWRHYGNGSLAAWLLTDTLVAGTTRLSHSVADLQWRLAGLADIDRNGQTDLVWQHIGNGKLAVWHMHGLTLMYSSLISPSPISDTEWRIVGVR